MILELIGQVPLEILVSIYKENGYEMGACPVLKEDISVGASIPLSALHINSIKYASQLAGIGSTIQSELLLKKEIDWASHIGLPYYIMDIRKGEDFVAMVRYAVDAMPYTKVLVRISIGDWKLWNQLRFLSRHCQVGIVLVVDEPNPEQVIIDRWYAEPIKMISIPTRIFLANKKGFPVLSKQYQELLFRFMYVKVEFMVSASGNTPCSLASYQEYLRYLESSKPPPCIIDEFAMGYQDVLQTPLQPLFDNLESGTYEVFEKDPVKYQLYEDAITKALQDWPDKSTPCVVMVVGAGRGPLVDRARKASIRANQKIRLYCIEKNSNAIITLRMRKEAEWGNEVEVVHTDMRFWNAPEKCDLMVSELLGSVGDNELSPECLDGAQRLLKDNGISIPQQYSAFVAPLSSATLYHRARELGQEKYLETPYVVRFQSVYEIAEPKPIWAFDHPNKTKRNPMGHPDFNSHNTRQWKGSFHAAVDVAMHGFAGYFECILYKDVVMSINPATHSPNMTSWFSMYFPLKSPIHVPKDAVISTQFWRRSASQKVWYEWSVSIKLNGVDIYYSDIHNKQGCSSSFLL